MPWDQVIMQFKLLCPICGFEPPEKTRKKMRAMRSHFRLAHKMVPDRKGVLHSMSGDGPRIADFKKARKHSVGNARFIQGGLPGRGKKQ